MIASVRLRRPDSVLKLDPDLGEGLDAARLQEAERQLIARLVSLPVGDWEPRPAEIDPVGGVGLLMVEGFMIRTLQLQHRAAAEILGPGDLVRTWQTDGEHEVYPFTPGWRILEPVTMAVLDRPFTARMGAYPEVTANIVGRAMARSRRTVGNLVLAQLASVEHRVLLALWHMADSWGRVRPDGVLLPVRLTHQMLGLVVGSRRPAVTMALRSLTQQGLVRLEPAGGYLLCAEPPEDLHLLRGGSRPAPA